MVGFIINKALATDMRCKTLDYKLVKKLKKNQPEKYC